MMAQQKLPGFPPAINGNPNIHAWYALHIDTALANINAMAHRNCQAHSYNAAMGTTLGEAASALVARRKDAFRDAQKYGQLLFCWHGTTALGHAEGGAA